MSARPATTPLLRFSVQSVTLALIATFCISAIADAVPLPIPEKVELEDTAASPDRTWVAERYIETYPQDTAIQIALHHPQTTPSPINLYIPYKSVGEDVLFKWLDSSNLLIAAAEGSRLETQPDEYYGVHLHYGHYPNDPDVPRIAGSQKLFTKRVDFTYRFEKGDGEGTPGVGCFLHMTATDGEYLDNISLRLAVTCPR